MPYESRTSRKAIRLLSAKLQTAGASQVFGEVMPAPYLASVKLCIWGYLSHFYVLWQAFQIQAGRRSLLAPLHNLLLKVT